MTVRVNKPEFNLREKLTELERPIGLKGSELMRAETTQEARDFVSAGRKNLVINGDMRINQRGSGVLTGSSAFPVDRVVSYVGIGNYSVEQYSLSSGDGPPTQRFNHSLRVKSTHGNLTASNAYAQINYRFEHTDLFNSGWDYTGHSSHNNYLTISFWVRSSVDSDFNWMFLGQDAGGSANNVFRPKAVTCIGGVWKKIIARVPPNPNITLNNSVDRGASLYLFPMLGTGYTSSTSNLDGWETWSGSNKYGVPTQNGSGWGGTSGATFDITGIQVEVSDNATEFEHRSYGEELALCQRYYFKLSNSRLVAGYKRHDTSSNFQMESPVPMRASPTATLLVDGSFTNMQANFYTTQSSPNVYQWSGHKFMFQVASTWSSTHTFIPSWESFTAEFSAEL